MSRHATNLFTLVLKNHDTGFGIPVAFLLTKSFEQSILTGWLKALCKKMKQLFSQGREDYEYKPRVVITDQGNTEISAIKTAFPGVPIHYCAWHVLKVWERELKKRMIGLSSLPVAARGSRQKAGKEWPLAARSGVLVTTGMETYVCFSILSFFCYDRFETI